MDEDFDMKAQNRGQTAVVNMRGALVFTPLNLRANSFTPRTMAAWNELQEHVKRAPNIEVLFESGLDKLLAK